MPDARIVLLKRDMGLCWKRCTVKNT